MKTMLNTTLLLGLLVISNNGLCHGKYKALEKAVEAEKLQILNATGNGIIVARECKSCPEVRLNITATTQALHNNVQVPVTSVPTMHTGVITVIYDPKTLNASRIIW